MHGRGRQRRRALDGARRVGQAQPLGAVAVVAVAVVAVAVHIDQGSSRRRAAHKVQTDVEGGFDRVRAISMADEGMDARRVKELGLGELLALTLTLTLALAAS